MNISKGALEKVIEGNVYRLLRDKFNKCPNCQAELEFDNWEIASELTDVMWDWFRREVCEGVCHWIYAGGSITDALLSADKELRGK